MPLHLDKFYDGIGKSLDQFAIAMNKDFISTLAKWRIFGGASISERERAIQEAVDALETYALLGYPNGREKKEKFRLAYIKHYEKDSLPPPSSDVRTITDNMRKIEAHNNILLQKFMLLDYWEAVATGKTQPEYPEDGAHWAMHEFLNFDPLKVRPILELLLQDAKNILSKPYNASLETWRGAEATKKVEFTKTSMAMTIKAEAMARVGAEVKGEFSMEYEGFKLKATGEAFVGMRAQASGEVSLQPGGIEAKGSVEVEIGVRIKGNVNIDVLDILEMEVGLDAIAGAMAKAEAEISISATGVKFKASAEAFAGAKITGTAKSTLKLGGRSILTSEAKGSLSAGVGVSAGVNFECDIFGKIGFGAKAGATLGLGAEGDLEFGVDFHNIVWGSNNLFWAVLNDAGFKNKGKVWFLPLEENVQMCIKSRDAMFKMLGQVYQQNEEDIAKLEAWKILETRVAKSVEAKNPGIKQIRGRARSNAIY